MTLLGLALGITTSASAAPGDHIRAGDLVVAPRLALGLEYRSNAFRSAQGGQGTGAFTIAPGVNIAADTPNVLFSFDGSIGLRKFFALGNPSDLDTDLLKEQVSNLDRFNEFNISGRIEALRNQVVGVNLSDTLVLRNNPNDNDIESDDPFATQLRNTLSGGLDIRPGKAFEIGAGGTWQFAEFYVPTAVDQRTKFNRRNSYGPDLSVNWTFLPRTAYVFESSLRFNRWADAAPTLGGGTISKPDSTQFKILTGVQGRITERLRLVAKVGFGSAFYTDGVNTLPRNGILAAIQGDYTISEQHEVSLGYRKGFFDSYFTNTVAHNSIYAQWKGNYGSRVSSKVRYGIRFENYDGGITRNDTLNQLYGGVDVKLVEWAKMGVSVDWLQRASTDDLVEYDDVRAMLNATFTY